MGTLGFGIGVGVYGRAIVYAWSVRRVCVCVCVCVCSCMRAYVRLLKIVLCYTERGLLIQIESSLIFLKLFRLRIKAEMALSIWLDSRSTDIQEKASTYDFPGSKQ